MIIGEDDLDTMVKVAEKIEKGKDCLTCGHSFTPIDGKDFFCKSCLRKLYLELLKKMEKGIECLISEFPWRVKEIQEVIRIHESINKLRQEGSQEDQG